VKAESASDERNTKPKQPFLHFCAIQQSHTPRAMWPVPAFLNREGEGTTDDT